MSGAVDVRAVLDFHIGNMTLDRQQPQRDELAEVRAAIAELIEQAEKASKMLHNLTECYVPTEHVAAWRADALDFRAALANCGGAQ